MCVCCCSLFVFCWEPINSTVVDRELAPWFLYSLDSGSYNGVLLESVNVTVLMCIFFLSGKGVALGGQLCFRYHPELEMDYSMYRKNECHVERGCGSSYPLGGTT